MVLNVAHAHNFAWSHYRVFVCLGRSEHEIENDVGSLPMVVLRVFAAHRQVARYVTDCVVHIVSALHSRRGRNRAMNSALAYDFRCWLGTFVSGFKSV